MLENTPTGRILIAFEDKLLHIKNNTEEPALLSSSTADYGNMSHDMPWLKADENSVKEINIRRNSSLFFFQSLNFSFLRHLVWF